MINVRIDPVIFTLGPLVIGWHGLFTALAVLVATWYGLHRARGAGLPVALIEEGLPFAVVGGFIGARLFHVADHLDYYTANPLAAFFLWQGGMAAYGGFIGAILAGSFYAFRVKLPVWKVLDAAAPAMIVGQVIGRCGCLLNGDAWGAPVDCVCGIVYWNEHASIPPELIGVPTHPYPLYEMVAGGLLLWLLLNCRLSPLKGDGRLFLLTALGYAVIRFVLSAVRQEPIVSAGLQEAQVTAVITGSLAMAGLLLFSFRFRNVPPEMDPTSHREVQ